MEERTNESILRQPGIHKSLPFTCYQRIQLFAHKAHQQKDNLEEIVVQGKAEVGEDAGCDGTFR